MKYKQFKEQVESLNAPNGTYRVNKDNGLILVDAVHESWVNCVQGICAIPLNRQYVVDYDGAVIDECTSVPKELGRLITEFISTPVEERMPEKKYMVEVFPGGVGYLNYRQHNDEYFLEDNEETEAVQTQFTQSEINKLKKRDDIAIDWNKVKIKEVTEE